MKRIVFTLFTVLLLFVTLFTACQPSSSPEKPDTQSQPSQPSTATPPPPTPEPEPVITIKEMELKYDDGKADDGVAIGRDPGYGHLISFTPPATPFTIQKIKTFGNLYGAGYENKTFDIGIWDKDLQELYTATFPHTKFNINPGWVEVEIPRIEVDDTFYIYICTYSPREGGIVISYDSSVNNEHSEVTKDFKIDWWLSSPSRESVNWMIRTVGTYMVTE
jgi:hypothetical protein